MIDLPEQANFKFKKMKDDSDIVNPVISSKIEKNDMEKNKKEERKTEMINILSSEVRGITTR